MSRVGLATTMHRSAARLPALAIVLSVTLASGATPTSIRHSTFADFVSGTPGNGGANLYVSRSGRVQVINKRDLNRDGFVDVLFSNGHDVASGTDALIYWGSRNYASLLPPLWKERPLAQLAFSLADGTAGVTRLAAFGGGRSIVSDLNGDGYPEIVFCNYIHNYPGVRTAFVYWGGREGHSVRRRTELPTNWAAGVVAADLNGDGFQELVFANQGVEAGAEEISPDGDYDSFIYWGSAGGFNPKLPERLATRGAVDVAAGDFDGDAFVDLAFLNNSPKAKEVQVMFGGPAGYRGGRNQVLPVEAGTSVQAGELDADGRADLVVTTSSTRFFFEEMPGGKSAPRQAAQIFLGGSKGFDAARTFRLPTYSARHSWIQDLNRDGWADLVFANASDGATPVVNSHVYWGSKDSFSAERRTELPTLGAAGVTAADLNGDEYADLVFANSNNVETYDVPSYIYWGSASGYAPYLRAELQSFGAVSVNTGDLDRDGKLDVVLVNQYSGKVGGVNTHLFWGNPHHHYSTALMTSLPGEGAYGTATADLNDDGWPDIVISNSYIEEAYLYWGGPQGFSPERRQKLPVPHAWTCSAADLNQDGHLDLVFTNRVDGRHVGTILWGSSDGYSAARRAIVQLKNRRSLSNVVADLNRDGYLDLVFPDEYFGDLQISWGSAEGYSDTRTWFGHVSAGAVKLADLDADGYLDFVVAGTFDPKKKSYETRTRIFPGTAEGTPSRTGVINLEAYGAIECAIADLNRDGHLDLVLSNYMSDTSRTLPVYVYWGGTGATYSDRNRTDLPAESSSGIQTVDLNRDGYPEIVVHNHVKDGDHTINSYIYWNSPGGFDLARRTELPNFGPHASQMVDPGNLYTRRLEEHYVSAALHIRGKQLAGLDWKGEAPSGTALRVQVRTAATRAALSQAPWRGPAGEGSAFERPDADLRRFAGTYDWMQYRVTFISPDGGEWPVLTGVTIALQ
jgi:hypothetical protein